MNYEGLRQESGAVSTLTVPLPEWRSGDFSNLRNSNGQPIVIYDPATTRPDPNNPGSFIRDPFPGNIIPQNRISAVGPRAGAVLAAAEHDAVERVHAGEQLRPVRRAAEQRGPRRLARRPRGQRQVAHVRPLLVLGRRQPGVQQLRERGELVRRRWPDVHDDAEPLDRQQLRAVALIADQRALRPESPLRRSQAAVGRLRPRVGRLRQQRRPDRAGRRVPAHRRPGLSVARAEHVHRPGDRPDDAPVQLQRHEDPVESHHQVRHGLPEVHAQLHAAVLPGRAVRLQQRAVDAAGSQRHELDPGVRVGVDAARHSELRPDQPQPVAGVGELLLGVVHPGRLEGREEPHDQYRPAPRVRRAADRALQSPELLRFRRDVADRRSGACQSVLQSVAAHRRPGVHGREQPPAGGHRSQQLRSTDRRVLERDAEDGRAVGIRHLLHALACPGRWTLRLRRHDGLQQPEQHDRQPRQPHPAAVNRQSVPRRLQPAARQRAGGGDVHGPEHRRRQRRCVHVEPDTAHATVERERAA